MSIWFKHDAHAHEHPKFIRLRRLARGKADAAEVGWYRILAAAKRLNSWDFEDEEHLQVAIGRYYGFVSLYREVGLLDGLTIHNADEYQSTLTGAERVAAHRARKRGGPVTPAVTPDVTDVTTRESRAERVERAEQDTRVTDDDPPWLRAWFEIGRRRLPSEGQQKFIDDYLRMFDRSGPQRLARVFHEHPDDPIGAAMADRDAWRDERKSEAIRAEREAADRPRVVRGRSTLERIGEVQTGELVQ